MPKNSIVLFKDGDISLDVPISPDKDTVWLTANQMAMLFDKDEKTVRKHINNVFSDEELSTENNTQKMRVVGVKQLVPFYTLDVIISVGYRVKSKRGIAFRRWANSVLKQYLLQGYAINKDRLTQLNQVIDIISRSGNPEIAGVSAVLERFTRGLEILDRYDHASLGKPKVKETDETMWRLTYEEGRKIIDSMKFGDTSGLFGNEKDNSFKSVVGAIYQSFDGKDVYPTDQEKAANLLYMMVKNHAFSDGNKRIAAALFVYFLDKRGILYKDNGALVIALSHPNEKEIMCLLVMNMLENE